MAVLITLFFLKALITSTGTVFRNEQSPKQYFRKLYGPGGTAYFKTWFERHIYSPGGQTLSRGDHIFWNDESPHTIYFVIRGLGDCIFRNMWSGGGDIFRGDQIRRDRALNCTWLESVPTANLVWGAVDYIYIHTLNQLHWTIWFWHDHCVVVSVSPSAVIQFLTDQV